MRSRSEHTRVEELEDQLIRTRLFARRLWSTVRARTGLEAQALFEGPELRAADVVFDAAAVIWDRHRVHIEPCRVILDGKAGYAWNAGPQQAEMYIGAWPDGSTRNLTRAQVLMMAGFDPEELAA